MRGAAHRARAACFNSDMGRVNVGAAKVIQITTSYTSNVRVTNTQLRVTHTSYVQTHMYFTLPTFTLPISLVS